MPHNKINITNCDKEQIQFLGKIQSYGFLIAADVNSGLVQFASLNVSKFLSQEAPDLLGKPLDCLKGDIEIAGGISLFDFCKESSSGSKVLEDFSTILKVKIAKKSYHLHVSMAGKIIVFEFQPAFQSENNSTSIVNMASRIIASGSLEELYNNSSTEIKNLIDYDRVMIYKFLPDGSGEVVGEAIKDHMQRFMGQRYPETDIPRQARALYKLNRMRLIADVDGETIDVIGQAGSSPFDMTYCTLRAVSPVHILYCKNMGLGSSFSISLIVEDELWGLITCHNTQPKPIDYDVRQAAMLLSSLISTTIYSKTNEFKKVLESNFQKEILQLQYNLSVFDSVAAALTKSETNLKKVTNANGVALIYKDEIFLMGDTPAAPEVKDLAAWAGGDLTDNILITNELSKHFARAEGFSDKASGVLITSLGNDNKDLIIWFKPEIIKTILWAGDPKKDEVEDKNSVNGVKVIPRTSFKVWRQEVFKTSEEWQNEEINAAQKITQIIRDIAFRKAEEQNAVNNRLKEAYDELDSFTYTVSHDLKNPLGVIKTYAQFLVHSNVVADEKGKSIVNKIVSGSDKVTDMLQSLLELSKMSRQEITYELVNMEKVIKNIINEQLLSGMYGHAKISLGDLPCLKGNSLLVYHIFSNVLSNAFKYSSQREKPMVTIKGYSDGNHIVYEVEDNGIGIKDGMQDEAFKLFKRLENAKEYEGTGAGLAIVKKNIERLGGKVFFKSTHGGGTIFYLTFCDQGTGSIQN